MRIQLCIPVKTNLLAHWGLLFSPLLPSDINNTESSDGDVALPPTFTRQPGDQERITRRRREKGKETNEGHDKFKGVRCAMVSVTKREHTLDHLFII
jgi:hypothetical protein